MLAADLPGLLSCRACPRLAAYIDQLPPKKGRSRSEYWNRPVPGFGDPQARVCLIGLAPGAHGANRTGRPFTGDGAGDFMYPLLYQAGFSNQPEAGSSNDGLQLHDLYLTNAVKCVPPGNLPLAAEFQTCQGYLREELRSLPRLKIVLTLGQAAYLSYLRFCRDRKLINRLSDHPFAHGRVHRIADGPILVASYHTSRYNIQTGRLTRQMFLDLLHEIRELLDRENG
jgi:uracil-DNA glycosylase family 4